MLRTFDVASSLRGGYPSSAPVRVGQAAPADTRCGKERQAQPALRFGAVFLIAAAVTWTTHVPSGRAEEPIEVQVTEHHVPISGGRALQVTEHHTHLSAHHEPRRAVLFLTSQFKGSFWTIPVEGYNGPAMVARRGVFAFTLDYLGMGQSSRPRNGSNLDHRAQTGPVREVIDFIRTLRGMDRVDLVGEGMGAKIAVRLSAEPKRVRSVVLTTLVYKDLAPEMRPFFSPELEATLRDAPDGYWEPDFLHRTLSHSPNERVREYVLATQPGSYPTGPALEPWDLERPVVDPSLARVPGLVIAGERDPFPAPGDPQALASEYGPKGAELRVIAGGFHVPRIAGEEIAARYFEALLEFLDP